SMYQRDCDIFIWQTTERKQKNLCQPWNPVFSCMMTPAGKDGLSGLWPKPQIYCTAPRQVTMVSSLHPLKARHVPTFLKHKDSPNNSERVGCIRTIPLIQP
uniref:Uncharacterized protein n=1 Tax=Labrus bergylta TaxID=56723 RepID=A0A3Q3M352_9LABR